MNQVIMPKMQDVERLHYRPAISVFLPFDAATNSKNKIRFYLDYVLEEVQKELEDYPVEIAALLLHKLKEIIGNLNFNSNKKSIAIYISPVFEKLLYLDIPIEQKVVFDDSFDIRDLIQYKNEPHNYLLLQIGTADSKVYLGNSGDLTMIVSNAPGALYSYVNDGKVSGFSSKNNTEPVEHNFIRHMDDTIDILLNAYQLPLFVIGCAEATAHFKRLTRHESSIVEYMNNNADLSIQDLKTILRPWVSDWEKVKQKTLINRIRQAIKENRLVDGFNNVWTAAMGHKGHLLLAGKRFVNNTTNKASYRIPEVEKQAYCKFSYVTNQMDDIIEKVLENGGNVELVPDDMLKDYNYIVLI